MLSLLNALAVVPEKEIGILKSGMRGDKDSPVMKMKAQDQTSLMRCTSFFWYLYSWRYKPLKIFNQINRKFAKKVRSVSVN